MVDLISDVGAIAKATEEALKLANQLADPNGQDRRFLKRKLKALYVVRNMAVDLLELVDPIMMYQTCDKKLHKRWCKMRSHFNKHLENT